MPNWLVAIAAFLTVLGFIQSVIWLNNIYFGPLWQRRISKRKSFYGLLEAGFLPVTSKEEQYTMDGPASAVALVGTFDGYAIEISSNYLTGWWTFPFYRVRVFFDTGDLTHKELLTRRENNLGRNTFFRWNDDINLDVNHVEKRVLVSWYGPVSSQFVLDTAKELIAELKVLSLKPVDYIEGIKQWRINQN
jgi:hypothetical protein